MLSCRPLDRPTRCMSYPHSYLSFNLLCMAVRLGDIRTCHGFISRSPHLWLQCDGIPPARPPMKDYMDIAVAAMLQAEI